MIDAVAPSTEIRRAQIGDAAEMARLSAQLGYPLSPAEMTRQLAKLLANERHHVAIAARGKRVLGWMHVENRSRLEGGERAELMGLVVDAGTRRQRLRRELGDVAERWAGSHGLPSLTVRSNIARELSHPSYVALGSSRDKTQHVYSKALNTSGAECTT
jgi:GNAT superfamily N-acetyltransferase